MYMSGRSPAGFVCSPVVAAVAPPAVADQRVVLATNIPVVPAAGQVAPLPCSL